MYNSVDLTGSEPIRTLTNNSPLQPPHPDVLQPAKADRIANLLDSFWRTLAESAPLIARGEHLLAAQQIGQLRAIVLELMLALNGIAPPTGTQNLNHYLSLPQRQSLERTLLAPQTNNDIWLGQAVALTVIYRWYAPQLCERFGLSYPQRLEDDTFARLRQMLPDWPKTIDTE